MKKVESIERVRCSRGEQEKEKSVERAGAVELGNRRERREQSKSEILEGGAE